MKKITALISGACLAAVLALPLSAGAIELTIGDAYYLGSIRVPKISDPIPTTDCIDHLVGMDLGTGTAGTNPAYKFVRSSNPFQDLPAAEFEIKFEKTNPLDLPGSYVYLLANYTYTGFGDTLDSKNFVWVISGMSGEILVPSEINTEGKNIKLSSISLFNQVPDGGLTLMLLGSGLTGLAALRRKLN